MTVREAIQRLAELDSKATIYVEGQPDTWTAESEAGVGVADVETGARPFPEAEGRTYFLEVAIALEMLSGWASNLDHAPTLDESVGRVIHYARYDA